MKKEQQHEHNYVYGGVVYVFGDRLPGSGARQVRYYDRYYCAGCLDYQYQRLDFVGSSYDEIRFNATPAPQGARLS